MTERHDRIAVLARQARGAMEQLLEALHWPAEETAFHRTIDRCLQLEEERNASE